MQVSLWRFKWRIQCFKSAAIDKAYATNFSNVFAAETIRSLVAAAKPNGLYRDTTGLIDAIRVVGSVELLIT